MQFRKTLLIIATFSFLIVGIMDLQCKEKDDPYKVIETMIKAIKEKNDPMRNRMYFKLRILESESVEPLLKTLKNDALDLEVKEYLIYTLGWIFDDRVITPLIKWLESDLPTCRATAARALGNHETKKAVPALIKTLEDKVPEVRRDAAFALGLIAEPKALPHLKKLLNDENELVRFFTKEAIENIEWEMKYGKESKNKK